MGNQSKRLFISNNISNEEYVWASSRSMIKGQSDNPVLTRASSGPQVQRCVWDDSIMNKTHLGVRAILPDVKKGKNNDKGKEMEKDNAKENEAKKDNNGVRVWDIPYADKR